jgi:glycosyltransferase involved in cell wall biosynthesis
MLLHFLRWLKLNTRLEVLVLLRSGGDLELQFAEAGKTWLCDGRRISHTRQIFERILRRVFRIALVSKPAKRDKLLNALQNLNIDLIYSNTITNGDVLEWLEPLQVPVLTHVHEMSYWIKQCGETNLARVRKHSLLYIAASHAVQQELSEKWEIPADRIEVVHEFIPTRAPEPDKKIRQNVRALLGVPDRSLLVVGSGVETWRKGKDVFVELAELVNRKAPENDFHFLWVGSWDGLEQKERIMGRILSEGLERKVMFIGEVDNPLDYFAASDVFALTSREDPYPLVCLEAALMGLPVLCFENAGGMPEFVEHDGGMIFGYLDVAAMANGIIELAGLPEKRQLLGATASAKVKSQHDVGIGGRRLYGVMLDLLDSLENSTHPRRRTGSRPIGCQTSIDS